MIADVRLEIGDMLLSRGDSWLGRAIRFWERQPGEAPARANHVGIVVEGGNIQQAVIVEALWTVKRHGLWENYHNTANLVCILRPPELSLADQEAIAAAAAGYVGRKYGWLKIGAHMGDRLLERMTLGLWRNPFVLRRLASMDQYPICSWVVEKAYAAAGIGFGVPAGSADPDDLEDGARAMAWMEPLPWTRI